MSKLRWVALASLLVLGSNARAGGEPCKLATKGDSIVAKACADPKGGGFSAAKKLMKAMRTVVNKGSSEKVECTTCHDHANDDRFDTLTKDGRDRFKGFLAEYDKKK